ncbi:MAG: DUF4291 domain-containing protein [Bacteroidetes bacterium]|nr:DUF4291 domain-containing protein [Bacteroidota bacterium]
MHFEKYTDQLQRLPKQGKHIIGHLENNTITVYQAFNPLIAEYAAERQVFGGPHYSFSRMSWIKPGFLWMMYRAGWASKEHQQNILAITLPLEHFYTILSKATHSSYNQNVYPTKEAWQKELEQTEVRIQWDPDHDPVGKKQDRRAIQLGLKGETLQKFATQWISRIDDITPFVKNEYEKLKAGYSNDLLVPFENVLKIENPSIAKRIGIYENN